MNADYDAVIHNGQVYCVECVPDGIDQDAALPVYHGQPWTAICRCCVCGTLHKRRAAYNVEDCELGIAENTVGLVCRGHILYRTRLDVKLTEAMLADIATYNDIRQQLFDRFTAYLEQ